MSIGLVITRGFGNGTLVGDPAKIITRGFGGAVPGFGIKRPIRNAIRQGIRLKIRNL